MYNSTYIFNKENLNIFTDASMKTLRTGEQIGCIGSILVHGDSNNFEENYIITRNSTNNDSEIKAIRLGIEMALKYKGLYKKIRLFSDSQISIYGIRERIFNWKVVGNSFIGTSGNDIKNQITMIEIINTIIENKLEIEFYHQNGHVEYNNNSLSNALHVFKVSNNIREDIPLDFIKDISIMNNLVDKNSGDFLQYNYNKLEPNDYMEAINFSTLDRHFNKQEYLSLIQYK